MSSSHSSFSDSQMKRQSSLSFLPLTDSPVKRNEKQSKRTALRKRAQAASLLQAGWRGGGGVCGWLGATRWLRGTDSHCVGGCGVPFPTPGLPSYTEDPSRRRAFPDGSGVMQITSSTGENKKIIKEGEGAVQSCHSAVKQFLQTMGFAHSSAWLGVPLAGGPVAGAWREGPCDPSAGLPIAHSRRRLRGCRELSTLSGLRGRPDLRAVWVTPNWGLAGR